jgi:hypothetical protein
MLGTWTPKKTPAAMNRDSDSPSDTASRDRNIPTSPQVVEKFGEFAAMLKTLHCQEMLNR